MADAIIKPSASKGELSPAVWGRLDFAGWHSGASVVRNCFVSYRGGASSRAGLKFVGQCRQQSAGAPPRLVRFQFNIFQSYILEFGDSYMRVIANGGYVTEPAIPITALTAANPMTVSFGGAAVFSVGDWLYFSGTGLIALDGRTLIVTGVDAFNNYRFTDTFGNIINSLGFPAITPGATAARIYTITNAPYAAVDLPFLKVVQSADVMSLCCVNQQTGAEYAPVDLQRLAANNWSFQALQFAAQIAAPASCSASTSAGGTTRYEFVVTAVSSGGEESNQSPAADVASVDIGATAGSLTITWSAVPGAGYYNIYQAPPSVGSVVPAASNYGYLGTAFGNQFVNSNIVPDFVRTPPLHINPFARGQVAEINVTAGGSGFVQASATATMVTSTGSGAVLLPIVIGGAVVAVIVQNPGQNYAPGDTVVLGGGSGGLATAVIGPQTGTYPGLVNYFQGRRVYAASLNNPDTYWMSQTGNYINFDQATPPIDSDAITGTPWGQQVNGIQWAQPMPGGLLLATGEATWQLSGTTGVGSLVTPAQQSAAQQESNGYSPTVQPLKINYDLLYVGSYGSYVYDLKYNYWNNIYAGTDISVLSDHLFNNFNIIQWAWAKNPNKTVWAARSDGKFLSLTFLPEQELIAWARHDTNGIVVGVEVASEPPVTAPYFVVKRYIIGQKQWAYYVERMDDRNWNGPEDPWCVDAGLSLVQPTPAATLTASAAGGDGIIYGGYLAEGGYGYSAPSVQIVDPLNRGSGGAVTLTQVAGVITGFTFVGGSGYSPGTYAQISDPTGAGATLVLLISQNVQFQATSNVFASAAIGDVIRVGGGIASISQLLSATSVLASIVSPIINVIQNDPNRLPLPAAAGQWTLTRPVSTLSNLWHLEGMQVAVLADGAVVAGGDQPLLTVTGGAVTLPGPASSIKIGLPYVAQYQTMHAEMQGAPTMQTKRKNVTKVALRLQNTRGIQIGANQPVASTLNYQQEIPWAGMQNVPDYESANVPTNALPLYTGDTLPIPVSGGPYNWNGFEPAPGMVACQQLNPLPMNVLAVVPWIEPHDK